MAKSKILYISCHAVLEYEEVKMFHELGYQVFSLGAYTNPTQPDDIRPALPELEEAYDPDIRDEWRRICEAHPGEEVRDRIPREFLDKFDIVIYMHMPHWIINNWENLKHNKRVIWRTIGQSVAHTEQSLRECRQEGLEIVRYSPKEATIPGWIGQDGLIRFYKDPDVFRDWNGGLKQVTTVSQSMQERDGACNFSFFEYITRPFKRALYGSGSENLMWGKGRVPYEDIMAAMRNNRVYFYTGTHPASYTLNFIEAWMTGSCIVAIGKERGNSSHLPHHELYEVDDLITNEVDGFVSDDPVKLRGYIAQLLADDKLAHNMSQNARASAMRHFGKDMIYAAWDKYLGG